MIIDSLAFMFSSVSEFFLHFFVFIIFPKSMLLRWFYTEFSRTIKEMTSLASFFSLSFVSFLLDVQLFHLVLDKTIMINI